MSITITGGISFGGGVGITAAPPTESTAGWFGGGYVAGNPYGPHYSTVDRITYATDTVTATVRGPLSLAANGITGGVNTFTYGWHSGGLVNSSSPTTYTTVNRITFATDSGTASVRGPLSSARSQFGGTTDNTTYGWYSGAGGTGSSIDRIVFATDTETATVRTQLTVARGNLASTSNSSYGWYIGGTPTPDGSTVERITFSNDTATASVRGPLSSARWNIMGTGNSDYGWIGGGASTTVNRITYANDTAVASIRGTLTTNRDVGAAAGNSTDGWFAAGSNYPLYLSSVERITYSNDTVTASLRGPLTLGRNGLGSSTGVQ